MPKPGAAFNGYWHCGKKRKGERRACTEFLALSKKSGGELPQTIKERTTCPWRNVAYPPM